MPVINTRLSYVGKDLLPEENVAIHIDESNLIQSIESSNINSTLVAVPGFFNAHIHTADIGLRGKIGTDLSSVVGPGGVKQRYLESLDEQALIENISSSIEEANRNAVLGFVDFREGGLAGLELLTGLSSSYYPYIRPTLDDIENITFPVAIGIRDVIAYDTEIMVSLAKKVHQVGGRLEIHASEDVMLRKRWIKEYGMSDIQWSIRNLQPHAIIHGTHLNETDVNMMQETDTALVLCPSSNRYFRVGDVNIDLLRNSGITIGLGSDNAMVNPVALWAEISLLQERDISNENILRYATISGAATAGIEWGISDGNSNLLVYDLGATSEDEILDIILSPQSQQFLKAIIQPNPH